MLCVQKKFHWNFIWTSLELHGNLIESIAKVGGSCKILVRFIRSSNKANSLHSTRLVMSRASYDTILYQSYPIVSMIVSVISWCISSDLSLTPVTNILPLTHKIKFKMFDTKDGVNDRWLSAYKINYSYYLMFMKYLLWKVDEILFTYIHKYDLPMSHITYIGAFYIFLSL